MPSEPLRFLAREPRYSWRRNVAKRALLAGAFLHPAPPSEGNSGRAGEITGFVLKHTFGTMSGLIYSAEKIETLVALIGRFVLGAFCKLRAVLRVS